MSEEELILVTASACPHCKEMKKALQEAEIGFRELSVDNVPKEKEEAVLKLVNELEIRAVPTLVIKRGRQYCVLEEEGGKLKPTICKELDVEV